MYRLYYNTHELSCIVGYDILEMFAKYMTGKEKYPVAVFKIKIK